MLDKTNPKDLIGVTKPNMFAIPPTAMLHESMAFADGGNKYGFYNWREKAVRADIYIAAAKRHIDSYLDREDYDPKSKCHHLGHARACLGIILDALETGNLIDNRPVKGASAEMIRHFEEHGTFDGRTNKD